MVVLCAAALTAFLASGLLQQTRDGVSNAVVQLFGSPEEQAPIEWEGAYGDEDGQDEGSGDVDQGAVDDAVEQAREFIDPNCSWWQIFCSGPNPNVVYDDLSRLSQDELGAVLSELDDDEIVELLSVPSDTSQRGRIRQIWNTLTPETRARLREDFNDPMFGEPSFSFMDEQRGYEYEYRTLEDGSLWGTEGEPRLADVQQGAIGDCWWMASMGAVADDGPEVIMDMIEENSDGTSTVTFPDGQEVTATNDFPYDTTNHRWALSVARTSEVAASRKWRRMSRACLKQVRARVFLRVPRARRSPCRRRESAGTSSFPRDVEGATIGDHMEPFTVARWRFDTSPCTWGSTSLSGERRYLPLFLVRVLCAHRPRSKNHRDHLSRHRQPEPEKGPKNPFDGNMIEERCSSRHRNSPGTTPSQTTGKFGVNFL